MATTVTTKPNTQWSSEGGTVSTSFSSVGAGVTTSWSTTTTNVNSTHGINTSAPNSTWDNYAVLNWGESKSWAGLDYLWSAE